MALFVLPRVAGGVRPPPEDGIDALLHEALFAATRFALSWAICFGILELFLADLLFDSTIRGVDLVVLLLLGLSATAGFVSYLRHLRQRGPDRWPRRATALPRTRHKLAGCVASAVACLTYFAALTRADAVQQRIASDLTGEDLARNCPRVRSHFRCGRARASGASLRRLRGPLDLLIRQRPLIAAASSAAGRPERERAVTATI